MMKRYRRRPIEIEAIQWIVTKTPSDDAKPIVDYINANGGKAYFLYDFLVDRGHHEPRIMIKTLEGEYGASPNDFICRGVSGVSGEYWSVKPEIFAKTNELIDEITK